MNITDQTKTIQRELGLSTDGVYGPITARRVASLLSQKDIELFDSMSAKEATLVTQGVVGTTEDGIWGPSTAAAVINWLLENGHMESTTDAPSAWDDLDHTDAIDVRVHDICEKVLNVFETGSQYGDYSKVTIYADGPGLVKQITYGKSQTTESGSLKTLLETYLTYNPTSQAASVISSRVATVGKTPYKVADTEFITALKQAGQEDEMVKAQDAFFDSAYFNPAYRWFTNQQFTYPLSMLVIYDSFIHSGGILSWLRSRFTEAVPSNGGDEKAWIKAYINTRRSWLASHSNTILRKTVYRMDTMLDAIAKDNWDLTQSVKANGTTVS